VSATSRGLRAGHLSAEEVALIRPHCRPRRALPRALALGFFFGWARPGFSSSHKFRRFNLTSPNDRLSLSGLMMDLADDGLRTGAIIERA